MAYKPADVNVELCSRFGDAGTSAQGDGSSKGGWGGGEVNDVGGVVNVDEGDEVEEMRLLSTSFSEESEVAEEDGGDMKVLFASASSSSTSGGGGDFTPTLDEDLLNVRSSAL